MKLNKIVIVVILTFCVISFANKATQCHYIVTFSDSIITISYSIDPNTFDQTVSPSGELKGEKILPPKNAEIRWKNCSLEPVVQRLLSRVILKVLLALPGVMNKPDKPPKSCQWEKLSMFILIAISTFQ
ncbi:conserved hypothetical protein [Photorhabdus asymbiotica]|uniref:Fimbrial protein n=2 Tax=Photorhabdus asymbiotica TaxID=291112 RepID=B6VK89_PHOAA|nr:hypothetical protein BDD30_1034 [Photorhabdus asymbiotica]CAQ83345.1 conserved hypothetical protein [Photorhabdus asymbiotica]CAR66569.1 Conserved Hypothetical Protein [Photorhabdus asymbiotica subsp. asymbiotica ATCC 43949]